MTRCPHCKRLIDDAEPIERLLAHVMTQAKLHTELFEKCNNRMLRGDCGPRYSKIVDSRKKTMDKWVGWQKALEALIEQSHGKDPKEETSQVLR